MAVSWEDLERALPPVLMTLPADAFVVIHSQPTGDNRFMQFMQLPDVLLAEVSSDDVLTAELRASDAGREEMYAMGWILPPPPHGSGSWQYEFAWPAPSADYVRVASMAVRGLRDVYGMADTGPLAYRAWDERERESLELPALQLPRQP